MKTWFQKHADTAVVVASVVTGSLWIQSSVHKLESEMVQIKTVLILKGIMPQSMAKVEKTE